MEATRLLCFSKPLHLTPVRRDEGLGRLRACKYRFPELNLRQKDSGKYISSLPQRLRTFRLDKKGLSLHAVAEPEPEAFSAKSTLTSFLGAVDAFYRFTRPHTVIGTFLSVVSVSLLAVSSKADLSSVFVRRVSEVLLASLLMNVYIVGLNQLSDIEIDKINKPYLPLASGEFNVVTGVLIVLSSAIMSFWVAYVVRSWPLFGALFFSFILGTAYSIDVPMLRWKRSAVLAALCIITVRALIVQLLFYMHMQVHVYQRVLTFSKPVVFATAFMGFFSIVIALFKDIPDIKGDEIFGIRSFTVSFGQKRVFWTCISVLELAYAIAILVGARSAYNWSKFITIAGHSFLASLLWRRAKSVDLKSKASITACYMFIWKLFYAEYFLIPFVR